MDHHQKQNQLDLDAPLLSVRRFPFYKSELKSGPVRDPGVVPFVWEQAPGLPKPKPLQLQQHQEEEEEEEQEKFVDALDTLSRAESCYMNCSVSGTIPGAEREEEASGTFSTDPQVRDFMMRRFLPAAQAMATASPHSSSRKQILQARDEARRAGGVAGAAVVENGAKARVRFPLNYNAEDMSCSYEEEEERDCCENGDVATKACGLIPKFCLLNPVPGVSVRSVRGGLQVGGMQHHGSLGRAEEEVILF